MSEMKMSDVFKLPMVQGSIVLMSNDHRYVIEFDNTYSDIGDQIEHVAHAINNHDRMVEEIAEFREVLESLVECASINEEQLNDLLMCGDYGESKELCDAKQLLNQEGWGE